MRLAGPVTRKICGGDVGDGLWVDVDDLEVNAVSMMKDVREREEATVGRGNIPFCDQAPPAREREAP